MSVIKVNTIQNANGTTALTFAANGQMTLANTPLQLTGGQIKFPSTKIASADGNTLDDYEEGVWNPVVVSGSGTLGSYTSVGNYTKVGRLVSVWGYFNITSSGSAGGEGQVTLPFAAATSTSYRTGCGSGREDNLSGFMIQFYNLAGGTRADLTTTAGNALTWTTGYGYIFSMQYII